MEVYVFPAVKHPPCSAQNPGPSQEVIVSLSTEPWSCLGDSECFQSLPSWPVISGDDLGHLAHRQKIQLRNCYRSTCEAGGGALLHSLCGTRFHFKRLYSQTLKRSV